MPSFTTAVVPPLASSHLREKVPFITAWSGETFNSPRVVWRDGRIGYASERPRDRDAFGVLWRRVTNGPGQGRPEFKTVHHARQRRAMGGLLCQVCARPTRPEATEDGVLFLLGRREYECEPWPAPIETTHPPVCLRCVATAVQACPHLRGHYVTVRCRAPRLYGVNGVMYRAGHGRPPVQHGVETVPYGSPRISLVQAAQSVVRLDRYTLVDPASGALAPGF